MPYFFFFFFFYFLDLTKLWGVHISTSESLWTDCILCWLPAHLRSGWSPTENVPNIPPTGKHFCHLLVFDSIALANWLGTLSFPSMPGMPHLFNLDKAHAVRWVEAGISQKQALFGVSIVPLLNWWPSSVKQVLWKTGHEMGVPRKQLPKKTGWLSLHHWGMVDCLPEICRQDLLDIIGKQLSDQSTHLISEPIRLPGGPLWLPFTCYCWCWQKLN